MLGSQYGSKIGLSITALVTATSLFIAFPLESEKVGAHPTSQEQQNTEKTATEETDPLVPPNLRAN